MFKVDTTLQLDYNDGTLINDTIKQWCTCLYDRCKELTGIYNTNNQALGTCASELKHDTSMSDDYAWLGRGKIPTWERRYVLEPFVHIVAKLDGIDTKKSIFNASNVVKTCGTDNDALFAKLDQRFRRSHERFCSRETKNDTQCEPTRDQDGNLIYTIGDVQWVVQVPTKNDANANQ